MTTSLAGAHVLVTGATGGLGAAIARRLAAAGARLTLVARDGDRLVELAGRLATTTGAPTSPTVCALDLREPGAAAAAVTSAVGAGGGLDGIVHAAGVVAFGPAAELDDAVMLELFETNLFAAIRLVRAAYPHLQASAGQGRSPFVVNLSAVVAEQPMAGMAAYTASKAALTAYDAAAGRELRRARIRLVDVRPPHTQTGLATHPIAGAAPALAHGLDPEDVADRVVAAIENDERDLPSSAFS